MFSKKHAALLVLLLGIQTAHASSSIDQYASSVLNFSSQWSPNGWAATQVLGAPDTTTYGDIGTSWAPSPRNGSLEFITVGFDTAVYANGATIRETWGNGFVYQIDVLDTLNNLITVWTGTDTSQPGSPVDFLATWAETSFAVKGLKIYTNTDHDPNAWEEIDSIQLHGTPAAVPLPAAFYMMGAGLLGLVKASSRKRV